MSDSLLTEGLEQGRLVTETVLASLTEFGTKLVGFIPNLLGAIVLLLLGKFFGNVLKSGVMKLLRLVKLESLAKKLGISNLLKSIGLKITTSEIFGVLAYWVVYLVFILAAVETLGVETISDIVSDLIAYIPNVIAALLILLIGIIVANFVKKALHHIKHGKLLGEIAYILILIMIVVSALEQINIEISFFTDNIQILMAGLALAVGLAFGLGGKDIAKDLLDKAYKKK